MSPNLLSRDIRAVHSIETRLTLILLLFVLLFISAAVVGWILSIKLQASQETLSQQALPGLERARHQNNLTLQLLDFSIRLSSPIKHTEVEKIEKNLSNINHMATLQLSEETKQTSLLPKLIDNLQEQIVIQKSIIESSEKLLSSKQYHLDKIDNLGLKLRTLISAFSLKQLESGANNTQNIELQTLTDYRFKLGALRHILISVSPFIGSEQSIALQQQYHSLIHSMSLKLPDLIDTNKQAIAPLINKLYDELRSDKSVFVLSDEIEESIYRLQTKSTVSIQLSEDIQKRAYDNQQKAAILVENHQTEVRKLSAWSLYFWVTCTFIALAFSFAMLMLYIRPAIIHRLRRITFDTKMIAEGNYDIDVEVTGKDEITLIALSLEHFKKQLIAKQQFEESLIEREAYLYSIYQYAKDGLFTLDSDGVVMSSNSAFQRMFGLSQNSKQSRAITSLLPHWDVRKTLKLAEQDTVRDGSLILADEELVAHKMDGSPFDINLSVVVIMPNHTRLFSCFIRDISEQKQAQLMLNGAIEKLTESNSELQRFASSCSHDLQEPMRMVETYSELLHDHLQGQQQDDKTIKYLSFIREGATNGRQLITGILQYSRLDQPAKEKEDIHLDTLLNRVANLTEMLVQEKSAKLSWNTRGIVVHAIEAFLFQLFINLVTNGIKFNRSPEPHVYIEAVQEEDSYLISVSDNGIGIDSSYHQQVFDIFKRLNSKRDFDGSGIGLAICKKVVEKCGGTLWLESELGQGSCFYIRLPIHSY